MAMLTTQQLTPKMVDELSGQYSAMLQPTEDPAFDATRQQMYAQNMAMQNNDMSRIDLVPQPRINESMIPPSNNPMLEQTLLGSMAKQIFAPEGKQPLGDYVQANWQNLLQQGISGLEDNYMRENLPADTYIKLKAQENDKIIAEQDRLLKNLQLQAENDYQRQSLELKREELTMERQKVLTGGDKPAAIKVTERYLNETPEWREIYDRVNKVGLDSVDLGDKIVFTDKVTGAKVGEMPKNLAPDQLPETKEKQARAGETGKELGAADAKLNAMEAALPGLYEVKDKLSKLGQIATYTNAGQVRDEAFRQLGMDIPDSAVARTAFITTIDNEVLPLLRDTFGAAFTVEEGNRLRSTLGNENLSPAEKDAALNSFIESKTREIKKLQRQTGVTPTATSPTTVPQIDPSLLEFMSPEERALFQ